MLEEPPVEEEEEEVEVDVGLAATNTCPTVLAAAPRADPISWIQFDTEIKIVMFSTVKVNTFLCRY